MEYQPMPAITLSKSAFLTAYPFRSCFRTKASVPTFTARMEMFKCHCATAVNISLSSSLPLLSYPSFRLGFTRVCGLRIVKLILQPFMLYLIPSILNRN